jgi:hypothetical protein
MSGSRCGSSFVPQSAGFRWSVLACTLLCAVGALADNPEPLDETTEATEGVLIMRESGAVVSGRISLADGLYTVEGPHGKMQLFASQVRMRCASLMDAYTRLHELTVKHQSADSHVKLARWCVTNFLDKEAIQELNAALDLEPQSYDAQRMLKTLKESLNSDRKWLQDQKPVENARPARSDAPAVDDAATLGGLSLSQALQYTRRIQPLLVKSCASTGCHTRDSENGFQLFHVFPGKKSNRHASEQNLAAVLEQIDLKKPASSRLLSVPRGKHGRNSRPVFSGPRGQEQFAELENWVLDVARNVSRRTTAGEIDGTRKSQTRQAAAAGSDTASARADARDPFAGKPASVTPFRGERKERTMSDSSDIDPFDPSGFNRQSTGGRPNR